MTETQLFAMAVLVALGVIAWFTGKKNSLNRRPEPKDEPPEIKR